MNSFLILLSAFVNLAVTTAPPQEIKTQADITKTCIYLSQQDTPTPSICKPVLNELNACANQQKPLPNCFKLIGGTNE